MPPCAWRGGCEANATQSLAFDWGKYAHVCELHLKTVLDLLDVSTMKVGV